jgi:xylan 1,4-beta-xylosidase
MNRIAMLLLVLMLLVAGAPAQTGPKIHAGGTAVAPGMNPDRARTWMADNGNGTYTNPLFYDEFSDPDAIVVGDDFYLTGTTMHTMPGLPVLRSKDLVNWEFLGYALDRLDLGPECRLEGGKDIYGQGIWAPCLRYHNGSFHIFSNVNKHPTQHFTATDPRGPWTRTQMNVSLHDLSVLFDDDGTVYAIWGYDEIRIAELNEQLTGIKPGTEQIIIRAGEGAGEGSHFTKIDGMYYITMAQWDPLCYQVCARARSPRGPYEISLMSSAEHLGVGTGWRLPYSAETRSFGLIPPRSDNGGCTTLHQGPIVKTPAGEWWALSMMDHNAVGRLTCLSPVTWENGWPRMGLPGNLTRTPITWAKPGTKVPVTPHAPYERSDDFSSTILKPVWQWNHVPVNRNWSLSRRPGFLTMRSLPAPDFWHAKNTLTQRAIGPVSVATTALDISQLKDGDVAGLALLNFPYAWIGCAEENGIHRLRVYDQRTNSTTDGPVVPSRLWLRVTCDFDRETALFSYSTDGTAFSTMGDVVIMGYQLRTFQGVRFSLFNYTVAEKEGGYCAFDAFTVDEPRPSGLTKPIPCNTVITLTNVADSTVLVQWRNWLRPVEPQSRFAAGQAPAFRILDRGNGRIALRSMMDSTYVTVTGEGRIAEVQCTRDDQGSASTFQWIDIGDGTIALLSLATNRYLTVAPRAGGLCSADAPGIDPDRRTGPCFVWAPVSR